MNWYPRCEGCGRFVKVEGSPSDFRWCSRCADGLSLDCYTRKSMVDWLEAERCGWPMWPLSDVVAA